MKYGEERDDDSKFNAGIDAQKRVMSLFRDCDRISLMKNGSGQETKHVIVKQLCIAVRGMFNNKKLRNEIWKKFKEIKLSEKKVSERQGSTRNVVYYNSEVDNKLDELVLFISEKLQDEKGFFSPSGDEPGL